MTETSKPTDAFLVKIVERAHSTGAEHWYERTFLSLEGVSKYLQEYLEGLKKDFEYPEEWDEDDMGCPFPGSEEFSVENIKSYLEDQKKNLGYDTPIWGPESEYECQAPREIFVKRTQIWS